MSSGATIGGGTTLGYATTKTGSYTPIAKIKTFKPPKVKSGNSEITTFDTVPYEQFIPAYINGGEVGFSIVYQRPGTITATLYTLMSAQTVVWWKLTLPDSSVWIFEGFLDEYEPNIPMKEAIVDNLNIKLTGDGATPANSIPGFTAGS